MSVREHGMDARVDVREARQKTGLTQEEFAHVLGVTVSTVNRWENFHSEPSKLAMRAILGLNTRHEEQ